MIERLREMGILPSILSAADEPEEEAEVPRFHALRHLVAELFLATGINATLQQLHDRSHARAAADDPTELGMGGSGGYRPPRVVAWAPALLAPLASAAQLVHTYRPSESSRLATRLLNGAALGFGVAGVADSLAGNSQSPRRFLTAPLLFGYVGVLAYLLERQETRVAQEREELERRARLVERFTPRRRTKIDRIVVHV